MLVCMYDRPYTEPSPLYKIKNFIFIEVSYLQLSLSWFVVNLLDIAKF